MKKPKIKIVIMIVSLLFFVVTIGLLISMSKIDKQTESTTTFYTATVISVAVTDMGENIFAEIHTKEYKTSLYISENISKNIRMDDVRNLRNGQTIFFGIENTKVQQMNEVEFVNITSLKTDTEDILSLEEYNKCIHNSVVPARIAGVIMASFFLFISLLNYLKFKRNRNISLNPIKEE